MNDVCFAGNPNNVSDVGDVCDQLGTGYYRAIDISLGRWFRRQKQLAHTVSFPVL